ncbi:MAG TPA: hypothetical protein VD833_19710 [Vicinamibacterales bacterium]|nr:hypothetical protein [Vicinamibacterales bacterium]
MHESSTRAVRLAMSLAAACLIASTCDDTPAPSRHVPIMHDFGEKIVYTTSRRVDVSALREHCGSLDGSFNDCGTVCAPDATGCVTVCAYTCEGIPQ